MFIVYRMEFDETIDGPAHGIMTKSVHETLLVGRGRGLKGVVGWSLGDGDLGGGGLGFGGSGGLGGLGV